MTATSPHPTLTSTTASDVDPPLSVRGKLAAAWASFMVFYLYVDLLHLYKPGVVDDILNGIVFEFETNQVFVVTALTLVGIPTLMIWLSAVLPARINRVANLIVATLYVPVTVFNIAGESWVYFYGLGIVCELVLLAYILRTAWTWRSSGSHAVSAR